MPKTIEEKYALLKEKQGDFRRIQKADRITVAEALTTADFNIYFPKTIEVIMLEAAEPLYLASQFFKKINMSEGRSMEFINFGAIRAHEVAEGQEYPETSLDAVKLKGQLTTEVKVKKYGLVVKVTEEMIADSQWDVIGMHLEAAGRALARKKEELVFLEFSQHGHVVFDADNGGEWKENADGTGADKDVGEGFYVPNASGLAPSGRGYDGTLNGTLTAGDFIEMCMAIMAAGFTPTDVIIHPLCYNLFLQNQDLYNMMHGFAAFGQGVASQVNLEIPPAGSYNLPVQNIRLIFSPYVPFNEAEEKFDMYIVDRNNVGVIVQKDEMSVEQFDDPTRDIKALKLRERYGVGILHGGLGIAVAKNIRYAKTWPLPGRDFAAMAMPADMTNANMDSIKTRTRMP